MLLRVKVKPNSRKDEVLKGADGVITVRITEAPVDGKANKYLLSFLASHLGLPKSSLSLVKGQTNQFKTIEIEADENLILSRL